MRKNAAEKTGVAFADLSSIRGKKEFQSAEGTVCYLADGSTILVSNAAATHPGDEGMAQIADKVIEAFDSIRGE